MCFLSAFSILEWAGHPKFRVGFLFRGAFRVGDPVIPFFLLAGSIFFSNTTIEKQFSIIIISISSNDRHSNVQRENSYPYMYIYTRNRHAK